MNRISLKSRFIPLSHSLFLILLAVMAISACTEVKCGGSKANFENQFENFLEKAEDLDYDLDDDRWGAFDKQFRTMVEECYPHHKEEMSEAERSKFWMGTLEFYGHRYGDGMAEAFADHSELISEEVVENIEVALEDVGKKLEDFMDKNGDELEDLFEEAAKDIEKWAERLVEILEEK